MTTEASQPDDTRPARAHFRRRKMLKHTPGPWVLQGEGVVLHPISHHEIRTTRIETSLGNIEVWDQTNEPEENVRLMTAAPELLAAVKGLLDHGRMVECDPNPGVVCPHIVAAEAAIAKAEGR